MLQIVSGKAHLCPGYMQNLLGLPFGPFLITALAGTLEPWELNMFPVQCLS